MRIALTGASGFIGRQVVAALAGAGVDVVAVSRRRPPRLDVEWIGADLLDRDQAVRMLEAAKAERLIHLAWTVEHGKFWTDPTNLDWAATSFAIARSAKAAGIQHITMCGTCFEYAWPADADCDEATTPTSAFMLYDVAKDACRRLIEMHARSEGYGFAWARLFHLYGEHEHPARLVAAVARAVLAGEVAKCSQGLALRDWMDVRDAGAAIAQVSLSRYDGAINVASGEAATVGQLATKIGTIARRPDLIALGALPDRPEPPRITAKVDRLASLGFRPQRTLDRGLADALEYWKSRL